MALLHLAERTIETSGVQETRAFSMKANGKAFKVLIDGLYSDKVRAVIRELWTNAYDAQVAAGQNDRQFETHLPTTYEPFFAVRDFGTSMTHEEVMGLYTTVFESSKEDTNDQVGKLGLGSKSPFAYTDTFTVTAWLDGEKRTYSAYIGENYIPQLSLMSREPSDEPQGLEVSLPVKSGDYGAFADAASFTAIGFTPPPIMNGGAMAADARGSCIESGDGWALYKKLDCAHARQGCVVYPVNQSVFPYGDSITRSLARCGLVVDFPIGALEITASREELGYDETTLKNIQERFLEVKDALVEIVANKLKTVTRPYDRMMLRHSLDNGYYPSAVLTEIDQEHDCPAYLDHEVGHNTGGVTIWSFDARALSRQRQSRTLDTVDHLRLYPKTDTRIMFYDTASGKPLKNMFGRLKVMQQEAQNKFDRVYVVRFNSQLNNTIMADIKAAFDGAPDDIYGDMWDIDPPKITKYPRSGTPGNTTNARLVECASEFDSMSPVKVSIRDGGYYVPSLRKFALYKHPTMNDTLNISARSVWRIVDKLRMAGKIPVAAPVYIVPRNTKGIDNPRNKWINVFDLADQLMVDEAPKIAQHLSRRMVYGPRVEVDPTALVASLPAGSPITEWVQAWVTNCAELSDDSETARTIGAELCYRPWEAQSTPRPAPAQWNEALTAYPLLHGLSEINYDNLSHITYYVNFVDSQQDSTQAAA